jgi:hypothetical protein
MREPRFGDVYRESNGVVWRLVGLIHRGGDIFIQFVYPGAHDHTPCTGYSWDHLKELLLRGDVTFIRSIYDEAPKFTINIKTRFEL